MSAACWAWCLGADVPRNLKDSAGTNCETAMCPTDFPLPRPTSRQSTWASRPLASQLAASKKKLIAAGSNATTFVSRRSPAYSAYTPTFAPTSQNTLPGRNDSIHSMVAGCLVSADIARMPAPRPRSTNLSSPLGVSISYISSSSAWEQRLCTRTRAASGNRRRWCSARSNSAFAFSRSVTLLREA